MTLTTYAATVFQHLLSKSNQPNAVLDNYLEMKDETEAADEIIDNIQGDTHYIGIDDKYVLLPMGNPTTPAELRITKQFYFVAHRNTLNPVIIFRVGCDEYQRICDVLKETKIIIENTTTVIVVSKVC